ncbi:MAG TPA: hypothetical protein VKP58_06085 [Candidatus Acidoferrum sp.]|nr:hypothetical protein [Candidatus Acidoferrum sp.]
MKRGEEFKQLIGPDLEFRLAPYAGNDSGWSIRLAPGTDANARTIDCIGAVQEPLHGDTRLEIEPPENGNALDAEWKTREFEFVTNPADCKQAWNLANAANYPSRLSDKQREEANRKLGQITTRHGRFTVLEARVGTAAGSGKPGTLEWLKFEVDLTGKADTKESAIRAVDIKSYLESHLGELFPDLADLETDCGEGRKPLQSLAPVLYGDLDGDGQEEAAVEGWSCLSGNGGADIFGVLKLTSAGKLVSLPIAPLPKTFKGSNTMADLRGHMVLEIKEGKLLEKYGIYTPSDPNCCPEGGERQFVYRWDGQKFIVDDMIDSPPEKTGNQPAN